MADSNKVKFGLKSVYYSIATIAGGSVTYGTPKAWPGAVSIDLSPQGGSDPFRADNMDYYRAAGGDSYSGNLTMAYLPDSVREDLFGDQVDDNGILVESANGSATPFALMFEFSGDANETRYVLYNCTASKPNIHSETTPADSVTPITIDIPIVASANVNGYVRGKADSGDTAYASWFTTVQEPDFTP